MTKRLGAKGKGKANIENSNSTESLKRKELKLEQQVVEEEKFSFLDILTEGAPENRGAGYFTRQKLIVIFQI